MLTWHQDLDCWPDVVRIRVEPGEIVDPPKLSANSDT
jgi:hypothetical protein